MNLRKFKNALVQLLYLQIFHRLLSQYCKFYKETSVDQICLTYLDVCPKSQNDIAMESQRFEENEDFTNIDLDSMIASTDQNPSHDKTN